MTNYTYRADGVKVKKLFNGLETDYLDGFQYKFTHTWEAPSGTMTIDEMKLRIIPTAEGYYDALRNAYFYNYTDHLGNVRVSYSDRDGNNEVTGDIVVNNCYNTPDGMVCNNYIITGEAEGVTNYYPFGMIHNGEYNNFDNAYQNKYNGKELQETGMYDYGARMYMSDIGRWGVVDPLAETSRRFTPYHYGNNNPVRFIDPDGRSTQTFTGGDIQNAFYQFYFGGSVSSVTGGSSFGSSGGESAPMFYNDEAGMMMMSALGNDGQGGGSSLSGWMQSYLSSPPDDHFNQFGQYMYTDNKATNNIVIDFQNPITGALNTASWLSKLLGDYKFDESNYSVLTNIANYYAKQAGVNMNNLKNGSTSLGIAKYHYRAGQMAGKLYGFNGGKFKPDALMSGDFETQVISIMVGNGNVSPLLNNKYNMISTLSHEGGTVSHLTLNPKTWIDGVKAHIRIYEYQMQSQLYQKLTTSDYKQQITDNFIEEKYNYEIYGPKK